MMFVVFLLAATTLLGPTLAAPPPEPIKIGSIKASSAMPKWKGYTFEATNLIDGRVDTSWQPKKSDTLGVGQWVEIDLGEPHAIDRIEIEQGLQKVDPKLGDLFCRNNRFESADVWFDDGSTAPVWATPNQRMVTIDKFYRGDKRTPGREVRTTARYLRLVVRQVYDPVDWSDLAIAEIRVFGRPASAPAVDPQAIAWNAPGIWPLWTAVGNFCAANVATQLSHACDSLTHSVIFGSTDDVLPKRIAPVEVSNLTKGRIVATFGDKHVHHLELRRATDGSWFVKTHVRRDKSGQPAPAPFWTAPIVDTFGENKCWESLDKKRPYEAIDYPDYPEVDNDSE